MRRLREMLLEDQKAQSKRVFSEDPVIARVEKVWMDLLKSSEFELDDDFFNVGGHSLLIVQLASALKLPVPDVMDKRTIVEQADLIRTRAQDTQSTFKLSNGTPKDLDSKIAVVGLSGRWPSAYTKDDFWKSLLNGDESLVNLTENEMLQAGVP